MLKKITFLLCSLIAASAFGMEPEWLIGKPTREPFFHESERITYLPYRDPMEAQNGNGWEIGDDRLGGGLTDRWQLWAETNAEKIAVLKPWVQAAKTIKVRAPKETYVVRINDITTVLDIKDYLQEDQGMSVEQQSINPVMPIWWTLGYLERKAAILDNSILIKVAMDMHNTDIFEVHLRIKSQE